MRYFMDLGYSEEFVKNFRKVLDELAEGAEDLTMAISPDAICTNCPHLVEGICHKDSKDSEAQIARGDNYILRCLNLEPGQTISFDEAKKMVAENLTTLRKICRKCQWRGYCVDP